MRRKIFFVLLIITALMTAGVSSAMAAGEEYAVVRVKISINEPAEYSFYVNGSYSVEGTDICLERQMYTVRIDGGGVGLFRGSERLCGGASVKLVRHTETDFIWMQRAGKGRYRYLGDMQFLIDPKNGCLMAVNHVYMEDYAYGVVPNEMIESWPRDALKAGAIAARTFAEHRMGSSNAYDVVDTTSNQVYYGYDPGDLNSIAAVNETANTVLKCGGSLVDVYYSASNGGFTEIPQHVWSATNPIMPYHIIQQDDFDVQNPGSPQDVLIFPKAIVPGVAEISYQYSDGGVMKVGASEGAIAAGYLWNSALPVLGSWGYYSLDAITGVNSIVPQAEHTLPGYNGNNACGCYRYAVVNMSVIASRNTTPEEQAAGMPPAVQEARTVDIKIDMKEFEKKDSPYFAFDKHQGLRLFTVADMGSSWCIFHRGNGHGIGLSQRGTEQRARAGQTYTDILAFYFPNTVLETQAYSRPGLTPIAIPDHTNATVTNDANVRTGPGTANPEIGTLPQGARLCVVQVEPSPGWHLILYGGGYAYMSASLIQLDNPLPPAEQLTVSFEANGGTPVAPWGGTYGGCIPEMPATSRYNFTFAGWFYDAGLTNQAGFPYVASHSTTLYAKWIENNCTVTFDSAGGSPVDPVTVANGYAINAPVTPVIYGFDFLGWYTDAGAAVSFPYVVTGSQTLHAAWSAQPQTYNLRTVGLSAGRLNRAFSKTVTSYKITLGENEESLTLTPYKEFDGAKMTINKKAVPNYTVKLANGKSTKISVKVAFGKKSRTYTFTVTRAKSSNNYLSSLSVSAGALSQPFDPNVSNYSLSLDENTKSVTIRAAAAAGRAASVSPSSKRITVNNGASTTVKITVKAQSGARRTYTIRVTRAPSTNASLKLLRAAGLSPRFSAGVTNYTITLPPNKSSITLAAGAAGYKAKVTIDGARKSSKTVKLANGQSVTVRVVVTSQAGNTKEYLVTVIRQ